MPLNPAIIAGLSMESPYRSMPHATLNLNSTAIDLHDMLSISIVNHGRRREATNSFEPFDIDQFSLSRVWYILAKFQTYRSSERVDIAVLDEKQSALRRIGWQRREVGTRQTTATAGFLNQKFLYSQSLIAVSQQ
ncbi:hypothetical protein B7494_g1999 [Chlorociboria aeruginascens]|nr:hypothetical protein B7494_g1999 [Chlorociboria aeruginascens]